MLSILADICHKAQGSGKVHTTLALGRFQIGKLCVYTYLEHRVDMLRLKALFIKEQK